jgi:hypothetical protein
MATTIIKDTKEITFAGSPQFVTVKDVYLPAKADNFYISIKIWTGIKTAIPTDVTISLFLPAVFIGFDDDGYTTKCTFEISKFLQEYIDNDDYISSSGANYNDGAAVWYNYSASATGTGGGNFPITSTTRLATNGYGRFEEGSNPGTTVAASNGVVFGNHSTKSLCDPSGSYVVPIYIGDSSTNEAIRANGQSITLASLGFTLGSADSAEQIAYVVFNSTNIPDWEPNKTIEYAILQSGTPLVGISFNSADNTYMNLGKVPLLNSNNSYVKIKQQPFLTTATETWFGYDFGGSEIFQMLQTNGNPNYAIQQRPATSGGFPNPTLYQELYFNPNVWGPDPAQRKCRVMVGGTDGFGGTVVVQDMLFTAISESAGDFYLGAKNNMGVADNFTSAVFTEIEFFNGTETKTYNFDNNWGGGINYGGVEVVSYDNGVTWSNIDTYTINIDCSKGNPMALKYYNFSGVLDTLPINGIGTESIVTEKTNYQNSILDSDYNYNTLSHIDKTFSSNGKTRYDVSTGWIYEESNQMVEELLLSKSVWLENNEGAIPVQIDTKTIQKINRLWKKQVDYSFSMSAATPIINEIT